MTTPLGITLSLDGVQQTEAGLRRVAGGVDAVGVSAKQTAAALRGVPAQFTDIVTSLASGQAPLTVFLQQGGQLKDMFGGAGNAAKALGGYVVGLVNPFTVAAAAGVALALAYKQGSAEADAYARSIALTGNAAGVTTSQLQGMAERVSAVVGTQSKAAEVVAQLVGTGSIASQNLEQFTATAIRLERNAGVAVKDTVKEFAELGKEPVEAAKKLNERYNYLTAAVYEQIKALQDQGKASEAATLSQQTYDKAMSNVATTTEGQLGTIERAWRAATDAAKSYWDAALKVGRQSTVGDEIGRVRMLIANKETGLDSYRDTRAGKIVAGEIEALRQQLSILQEQERMTRRGAEAQAERAKAEKAGIEAADALLKTQDKGLTKQQQMNAALKEYRTQLEALRAVNPNSERLAPDAVARGERAIRDQYKPTGSGAASGGENEVAALRAQANEAERYLEQLRARGAEVEKLTAGEQRAAKIREELKTSITGTARAQKELALVEADRLAAAERATVTEKARLKTIEESEAAYRKFLDSIVKTGDAYGTQADQQEAANASFGRSKTAIEEAALAQQKLYLANEKAAGPWDPARISAMEYAIQQQERYVNALRGGDGKAINAQADELLRSAQAMAAVYADEAQLAGLSALERAKTVALRQVELKYAKELAAIDRSSATEEEKQRARDTARQAQMVEGQAAVSKAVEEDWARTSKTIGDTLADYIMGGGKNAAQYLQRLFSTLVLQPVVQYGAGALMGAIGMGPASGGGGGVMGVINGASAAKNAYSLYQGGMSGLTAPGSAYYNFATSSVGQSLGLSNAAPIIGNNPSAYMPAGTQLANPLSGGMSNLAGAGVAAAVAALALNALGAFRSERKVGGGLSGTLGGGTLSPWEEWRQGGTLFGGPSYETFNPVAELQAKRAQLDAMQQAGLADSSQGAALQMVVNKLEAEYGSVADATAKQSQAIQTAYDTLRTSVGDMADVLGLGSEAVRKFTTQLGGSDKGLNFEGLNGDQIQAKIAEALATANNDLAMQVIGQWESFTSTVTQVLGRNIGGEGENSNMVYETTTSISTGARYVQSQYAREGEKAIDTLTRLASSLGAVNAVFESLGQTLYDASLAGGDMASQLVDLFGGIDQFTATTSGYFDAYYTDAERAALATASLGEAFGELGYALPANAAALRSLVESQDLTTQAGRKAYAALMGLSGGLAQLNQTLDATRSATRGAFVSLAGSLADMRSGVDQADARVAASRMSIWEGYNDAQQKVIDLEKQAADATRSFAQSLRGFVSDLTTGPNSGLGLDARYQMLGQQFSTTASRAGAGDQGARDALTGVAGAYLDVARANARTSVEYARDAARVSIQLNKLATAAESDPLVQKYDAQNLTLQQQIADAQIDVVKYLALMEATGTSTDLGIQTVDKTLAQLRDEYVGATQAQAAANLKLDVALAALDALGLTEDLVNAIAANQANSLSAALNITDEALASITGALGLTPENVSQIGQQFGTEVALLVGQAATDLAAAIGGALAFDPAKFDALRTIVGYDTSSPNFEALHTILGFDLESDKFRSLQTILGMSSEASAQVDALMAGIGFAPDAAGRADALAGGIGFTGAAVGQLDLIAGGLGISDALVENVKRIAEGVSFSDAAQQQLGQIAQGVGFTDSAAAQAAQLTAGLSFADVARKQIALIAAGVSFAAPAQDQINTLASGVSLSSVASAQVNGLLNGLTLSPAAAEQVSGLLDGLKLSAVDRVTIERMLGGIGFDPDTSAALQDGLGLQQGLLPMLGTALGLSAEAQKAIGVLSSMGTIDQTVRNAYAMVGRSGIGTDVSQIDQQGYDFWTKSLATGAVSMADFTQQFLLSAAGAPDEALRAYVAPYLQKLGVTQTGPQASLVVPAAYNPVALGAAAPSANNDAVVAELRALRAELATHKAELAAIRNSSGLTANGMTGIVNKQVTLVTEVA